MHIEHTRRIVLAGAVLLIILSIGVFFLFKKNKDGTSFLSPDKDPSEQGGEERVVQIIPKNDRDGDGLTDEEETALGTKSGTYDSDNDGIGDSDETERYQTDPTKTDTDGDGYSDGWEILKGYNPAGEGKLQGEKIEEAQPELPS